MKETREERLARIGAEAEAAEADQTDRPIPAHVSVSLPNRARSKVLQVRLNPEEFGAVERLAAKRGLPASTMARQKLLELVAAEEDGGGSQELDLAAQLVAVQGQIASLLEKISRPAQVSDISWSEGPAHSG